MPVEVLVGHSMGLRGVCTDPDAQPLTEAIKPAPAIGEPMGRWWSCGGGRRLKGDAEWVGRAENP